MLRYHLTWHMLSYFILSYPTMLRYHLVWCVLSYAPVSWCKWSIYCCFGLILILFVFVWMRRIFCMSKYMQMILPFSYSLLMARFTRNSNSVGFHKTIGAISTKATGFHQCWHSVRYCFGKHRLWIGGSKVWNNERLKNSHAVLVRITFGKLTIHDNSWQTSFAEIV